MADGDLLIPSKELVAKVIKNQAEMIKLDATREKFTEKTNSELYRIRFTVYGEKIRKLERQRDLEMEKINADAKKAQEVAEILYSSFRQPQELTERIISFLRLDRSENLEVKPGFGEMPVEDLGYCINDTYLKVRLYLYENRKPVNKYTLCAVGRCLFYEDMLRLPRDPLILNYTHYPQLEKNLKEGPTVAVLKEWLEHHTKLLQDELKRYQIVKADYERVIKLYCIEDFESLCKFVCPKCGYFLTILDNYSWSEPMECPRCRTIMEYGQARIEELVTEKLKG